MARGGARKNSGRRHQTAEEKAQKQEHLTQILIDELVFPAVCAAFHAEPGRWQERILTFELSSVQIRAAYGAKGWAEWKSYFTPVKKGGCTRAGEAYQTLWRFNTAKYGFVLRLVESLGHTIKDLPNPGFPPTAMVNRLKAIEERRAARQARKKA